MLLRKTDGAGKLMGNSYMSEAPMIGPFSKAKSADVLRGQLQSSDPVRQLDALVWLGGFHMKSTAVREKNVSREPVSSSKIFESLAADARVRGAIERLCESPNAWVKEQARFTKHMLENPPEDD